MAPPKSQTKVIGADFLELIGMFLDEIRYIHNIEKFGRAHVEGSVDSRYFTKCFVYR